MRTDLRILLEADAVAHINDGTYLAAHGEGATVTRLVRAGLLEQAPFYDHRVRLTLRGEQALNDIERAFEPILETRKIGSIAGDYAAVLIKPAKPAAQIIAETTEKCALECEQIGEKFRTGALAKMCAEACRSVR